MIKLREYAGFKIGDEVVIPEKPACASALISKFPARACPWIKYPIYGTIQGIALPERSEDRYVAHVAVNINGYGFVLTSFDHTTSIEQKKPYVGLLETNNIMHDRQFKEKKYKNFPGVVRTSGGTGGGVTSGTSDSEIRVSPGNAKTIVPDSAPKDAAHMPFFPNTEYYIRHFMSGEYRGTVVGYFVDDVLKIGISVCSEQEQFCKKTGTENAKKRIAQGDGSSFRFNPRYWGAGTKKGNFFLHCADLMAELYFTAPDMLPSIHKPIKKRYENKKTSKSGLRT